MTGGMGVSLIFLGLNPDATRNANGGTLISTDASRVTIRVMRTDEESMIARLVQTLIS